MTVFFLDENARIYTGQKKKVRPLVPLLIKAVGID